MPRLLDLVLFDGMRPGRGIGDHDAKVLVGCDGGDFVEASGADDAALGLVEDESRYVGDLCERVESALEVFNVTYEGYVVGVSVNPDVGTALLDEL